MICTKNKITEQNLFQDGTMDNYIKLLQEHRVSHLVCATDQLYKTEELLKNGKTKHISFHHTLSNTIYDFQE